MDYRQDAQMAPRSLGPQMYPPCLVGFCLSLVFPVSFIIPMISSAFGLIIFIGSIPLSLAGLIVSIVGVAKCKKPKYYGSGFAIAGIVISILDLAVAIFALIAIALGIALFLYVLSGLTGHAYGDPVAMGQFRVGENRAKDYAMVQSWEWSGDPEDTTIVIPDEDENDAKIVSIGNGGPYYMTGSPFVIVLSDDVVDFTKTEEFAGPEDFYGDFAEDPYKWGVPKGTTVNEEDLIFTIVIGENIESVHITELTDFAIVNDDGSITIYHTYLSFEVSEDNENFYTEDGVLYSSETDKEYKYVSPENYKDEE
ncbi:MAG: hypothetical protein J6Y08_09395 [Clostridiales bacterium]|nr:hypothetical protein [Clostridiales bacterium]